MFPRPRLFAVLRLLVLAGLVLGSTGCARLFSSYDVAPNGMARRDDALRRLLVTGRPDSALVRVEPRGESAPEDELLRSLYSGILAHYAGSYDSSAAALDHAAELAEDRYTKRVSRAALSLISNDKVLPYEPGEAERLLVHYYGALNYLHRDDLAGAAVEARRLSTLLERVEAPRDSELHGWLRYFSGAIFEAAGERNDAEVAYRNARALLGAGAELPGVASAEDDPTGVMLPPPAGPGRGMGEVVVLVEEGFVAHRVEQAIVMPLYSFEMDRMSGGDAGARLSAAAAVSTRVLALALAGTSGDPIHYGARPRTLKVPPLPESVLRRECATTDSIVARGGGGEPARRERPTRARQPEAAPVAGPATVTGSAGGLREKGSMPSPSPTRSAAPQRAPRACAAIRNPYLLRIAWPVYHQDQLPRSSWRVVGGGEETDGEEAGAPAVSGPAVSAPAASSPAAARLTSRISGAVVGEFQEERGAILARTILRGVAKAAVTRTIEKAPGEDASGLGSLLGVLVNVGTALLEQADTRSWHLLPDRIGLVRVQLPPGEHELALEVGGAGGATRRVELGTVRVRAGGLNFVSARIWP